MYNDFVLIGPKRDPAGVAGMGNIVRALQIIAANKFPFVSRGDNSGTHMAELALWKASGVNIDKERGPWYKAIGQGMGAALNAASAIDAYALSDRATWIHFENRGNLQIEVQGDNRMFNQYGVMLVNPEKHPSVKQDLGQQFIDYLISPAGQADIAHYKIDGQQLFYPDANDPTA
jgi:tungstate transport system substrate-binding protein